MKTAVPELGDFNILKSQFEWLADGEIAHYVKNNLGIELKNMEIFLRYVVPVMASKEVR